MKLKSSSIVPERLPFQKLYIFSGGNLSEQQAQYFSKDVTEVLCSSLGNSTLLWNSSNITQSTVTIRKL